MRMLLPFGISIVIVFGLLPDVSGQDQLNSMSFFTIDQQVRDVVYDRKRDVLYATVPSNAVTLANSIVTVNPNDGTILSSIDVGRNPNRIAISSDSSRVYVGVDGENGFRWWQPSDGYLSDIASLSSHSGRYEARVADIAVRPGRADHVAIAKSPVGTTERGELEIFFGDESVAYDTSKPANSIAFADALTLVTANNHNSGAGSQRFRIDNTELILESNGFGGGFNTEIEIGEDRRIYETNGKVFDVDTFDDLGRFSPTVPAGQSNMLMEPIVSLDLTYAVYPTQDIVVNPDVYIAVFDRRSMETLDFGRLPGLVMQDRREARLLAAGTNRLALTTRSSSTFSQPRSLTIVSGIPVAGTEPIILGDINGDDVVDFLDISPFIAILSTGRFRHEANIDRNGVVNFLDVGPFIGILFGL